MAVAGSELVCRLVESESDGFLVKEGNGDAGPL